MGRAGLARHVGIANINSAQLSQLLATASVLPAVVQTIFSPIHRGLAAGGGSKLTALCQRRGIVLQAFRALNTYAGVSEGNVVLQDPIVQRAAELARLSASQVL